MSSLAHLTIVRATREQTLASRLINYTFWGKDLSLESYMALEAQCEELEHALNGNMTTWVLVPRDDPLTLDIKCACETYRRDALEKPPGDAPLKRVEAYGVAAVYTAPENRKKGYAAHMMRLLHHVLANPSNLPSFPEAWGEPPRSYGYQARFSVLWSDLGKEWYKRCGPDETEPGWKVHECPSTIWHIQNEPDQIPLVDKSVRWLTAGDADRLWTEIDAPSIEKALSSTQSSQTRFAFLTSAGVASSVLHKALHARAISVNPILAPIPHWGASLSDSQAYAMWTLFGPPATPVLLITRIRAETREEFEKLLVAAEVVAREVKATEIEAWNVPIRLLLGVREFLNVERDIGLTALKCYGPERPKTIDWVFNESYALVGHI